MPRVTVPGDNQDQVLLRSGRRCCICFGLHADLGVKQGQIAHLDQDNTNYDLDNLAWLCLPHHDQYDSKTSQSKGFRGSEVKQYRELLYQRIAVGVANDKAESEPQSTKATTSNEPADRANLHVIDVAFEAPDIVKLESFGQLSSDNFMMMELTIPRPKASILIRNIGKYSVSRYVVRTAIILSEGLGPSQEGELFAQRPEWQRGGDVGMGSVWYPGATDDKVLRTEWAGNFQQSDWSDLIAGTKVFYIVTKSGFYDQYGRLPDTESCRCVSFRNRTQTMKWCWGHNT